MRRRGRRRKVGWPPGGVWRWLLVVHVHALINSRRAQQSHLPPCAALPLAADGEPGGSPSEDPGQAHGRGQGQRGKAPGPAASPPDAPTSGVPPTEAASGSPSGAGGQGVVGLQLSHLVSYERMGRASVTCVSGCACEPALLEGHDGSSRHSVPEMLRMLVSRSSRCVVQLEVLPESSSGEHKVKLLGAVVSTLRNATADVLALISAAESAAAEAAARPGPGSGGGRRIKL
jgi:hypothetical protein